MSFLVVILSSAYIGWTFDRNQGVKGIDNPVIRNIRCFHFTTFIPEKIYLTAPIILMRKLRQMLLIKISKNMNEIKKRWGQKTKSFLSDSITHSLRFILNTLNIRWY